MEESARHVGILHYWHKVEFFIPYDVQRQVLEAKDAEWSVRLFSPSQLASLTTSALWSVPVPVGRRLSGFEVYLGLFDKAELAEVTRRVIKASLSDVQAYEEDERGGLEGLTCGASIRMSADGTPRLDELSVSTVPWALGRIMQRGLDGLDFDVFQANLESLKHDVKTFRASFGTAQSPADRDTNVCTAADLLTLLEMLSQWAGYDLAGRDVNAPVMAIRAKSVEDKPAATKNKPPAATGYEDEDEDKDEEAEVQAEPEISILNSFFAEDLARAMVSTEQGTAGPALRAYLTPRAESARADLYEPAGRRMISERLQPRHLNRGRWPGNPAHRMSLMQQFAVNSVFERLEDGGLFSVNGPPGTGKTTLLREIFAENIVRRGRALAGCATAGDAFQPHGLTARFRGHRDCAIAVLKDELTGFEMVVASSNNAAVENISHDLPKNKSLGDRAVKPGEMAWRDGSGKSTFGYLQPVVRNLSERKGNGTYERPASDDDETWGLISCALGNKRNRNAFVGGLSFAGPRPGDKPPRGFDPTRHQSIWQWRDTYKGATFAHAKQAFRHADEESRQLIADLDRHAALAQELANETLETFCLHQTLEVDAVTTAHANAGLDFTQRDEEWQSGQRQVELLTAQKALIDERRPRWWTSVSNPQARVAHDAELTENRRKLEEWIRRQSESESARESARHRLRQAESALAQAQAAFAARRQTWTHKVKDSVALSTRFPQARHPTHLAELDADEWQIQGLWHSALVNEKRSALFVAALQLHEAWLAEVLKSGHGFGANVVALCHLLSGSRQKDPEVALALWRSLFMIVPVVSSTFASFARQFRDLGPSALGWLFVDEAGQAVPQAAVGALWRARRAVVVGDPLQIEPVFTVPIKLLQALQETARLPPGMDVSPDKTSVQRLADEANEIGANVEANGQSQWIGSPLRVHRRCVEPMFSIANQIAYEGKMIFHDPLSARQPPPGSLQIGPSAWVHAPGSTSDKQVVPDQVNLVQEALIALYLRTGALPPLYVITPFKRIKDALIDRLTNLDPWAEAAEGSQLRPPKSADLRQWCRERIGTVHTFQGKEESIVWLILGCDERTAGAAQWASSKPNLLNVALTRAKHRCFLIGDQALWGGLPNFVAAHDERLPRITPREFLQRVAPSREQAPGWRGSPDTNACR